MMASISDDQTGNLWDLKRILKLGLLEDGCNWPGDYLRTNVEVNENDRVLCNLR